VSEADAVGILLVEDRPAQLLSLEEILAPLGEKLIGAGSIEEALARARGCDDLAVVLIGVGMPDNGGFRLASKIREYLCAQATAILVLSATRSAADLSRDCEWGAIDYVPMPVAPELLRAKVAFFARLYRRTRRLEQLNAELERRLEERIRERESALARMHERQKLESIGQLSSGVAHDFNNLLMAVLGNLELLRKYVPEDRRLLRLIDGAIRGAERGAVLTKRLLAFARRQELRPEAVDVARLVAGMAEMLRRTLGPMIRITTEFPPALAPARADPNQLELALLNLALNARDAMPLGGHLVITARHAPAAEMPGLAAGDYVRIAVRDTGCGMDEATLRRAIEPFFTTKPRGCGTGLGLSMVHGLAIQSGGAMRIRSRPHRGTTVALWLPVAGPAAPEQLSLAAPPLAGAIRPCHVLVVDDDPIVAAGTAAMLEDLGHRAIVAGSAARALEILRAEPRIDIVVTDYAMPGVSGAELAARIERLRPGLPVILATGHAELSPHAAKLPRLVKPYRQLDLAAMIRGLVGGASAAAPRRTAVG